MIEGADVGKQGDVREIGQLAKDTFGGFDTWVNNAGVSIYGKLLDIAVDDMRRLFETNFWGVVYGSIEAARHLKQRGGGALVNLGSTVSDRAIPVQGIYSASKHAVKGFTDALRMELEREGVPISVTLIKPGAINTPYTLHAKNYMAAELTLPPPVYAPETVARAILHCAENPEHDVFVGGGGKGISVLGNYAPRLADKIMQTFVVEQQKNDGRARRRNDSSGLHQPSGKLEERGPYEGHVAESSLYTQATLHPILTTSALIGAGLAAGAWLLGRRSMSDERI